MRKVIRRIVRFSLRPIVVKLRYAIDSEEIDPESLRQQETIYPWLNWTLDRSVRKAKGRLRPNYTWALLHAGSVAKSLGISRIAAIEFGVAGGNGLLALENAAALVEEKIGTKVDVYGFDTGKGLPPPSDYRDLPNLYQESAYRMDVEKLRSRLRSAQLVLGMIEETLPVFLATLLAPIGFMAIDVDYYSSTVAVLKVLEAATRLLLPRVHCYFDDIVGMTFSEYTGERLAIAEFNAAHSTRKISPIFGLRHILSEPYSNQPWVDQMFLAHIFDHELYGQADGINIRLNGGHSALGGSVNADDST